jgi:hypothetical protein
MHYLSPQQSVVDECLRSSPAGTTVLMSEQAVDRAVVIRAIVLQRVRPPETISTKSTPLEKAYRFVVVGDRLRLDAVEVHVREPEPEHGVEGFRRDPAPPVISPQVITDVCAVMASLPGDETEKSNGTTITA